MSYIRFILVALACSLLTSYAVLWWIAPVTAEAPNTVIRPPLKIEHREGQLLIWGGGWKTLKGYDFPGTNAIEIRCDQDKRLCTEAYASVLRHSEGEDLEAQVFNYSVEAWTPQEVIAVATQAMGCLNRQLLVDLKSNSARLEWSPSPTPDCTGETGTAVLVEDPL